MVDFSKYYRSYKYMQDMLKSDFTHNYIEEALKDGDEGKDSIFGNYARTMRKDMTKAEFEAWTRDAEQKRDAALEPYARAESEEERQRIAQEVAEALNEA